jgi:hypothetical protein
MTGTDLCVNKPHLSRSYLNHLVILCLFSPLKHPVRITAGVDVPFGLYESETWSRSLREEHTLRMFENVLLKAF